MKDRDFLWCALNMVLDDEEELAQLCPSCRMEAERVCCPACGRDRDEGSEAENASFDGARFERLMQGGQT